MTPDASHDDERLDAEIEASRADLVNELGRYRTEVLDALEPSPRSRAAMKRMMVELVREDVRAAWRRTSARSRIVAVSGRLMRTWRELMEGSAVFRWASQGALALGVGLLCAFLIDLGGFRESRAATRRAQDPVDEVPTISATFRGEPTSERAARRESERVPEHGHSRKINRGK